MATVNVNSWSEFLTAIAVSGDTVVLPENAVWDMNEIAPAGVNGLTFLRAEVNGNGTEIKNMWLLSTITVGCTVNNLKLTNMVGKNSGASSLINIGSHTLNGCTFSAILESDYERLIGSNGYGQLNLCSYHVDMSKSGEKELISCPMTGCRCTFDIPNQGTIRLQKSPSSSIKNCEFVVNAPTCTLIYAQGWDSCTLRGDMQNVETFWTDTMAGVSIYCSDDMPQVSGSSANVKPVSDENMKSVSYLQSIGFTARAG